MTTVTAHLADAVADLPPFFTPAQLEKRWAISHGKLYDLLQSRKLESVAIGRCRRIPRAAVIEFEQSLTSEFVGN